VEAFKRQIVLFNRAITEGATEYLETLDEVVEWLPITSFLDGATYRGRDGVRRWIEELKRDWEIYEIALEEFRDLDDDRVLAIGSWHARGGEAAWSCGFKKPLGSLNTATGSFPACRPSSTATRPSKPWGCGSRRCRKANVQGCRSRRGLAHPPGTTPRSLSRPVRGQQSAPGFWNIWRFPSSPVAGTRLP
jgi:hypothetical protein